MAEEIVLSRTELDQIIKEAATQAATTIMLDHIQQRKEVLQQIKYFKGAGRISISEADFCIEMLARDCPLQDVSEFIGAGLMARAAAIEH